MKKSYTPILIIIGVLFVALAIYYWATAAGSLPHWLPGYEIRSVHHHLKHGALALVLGVGCFIWAWFASGSKPESKSGQSKDLQ
ncbi:MAG: hypothetical protein ABSD10_02205 [Candidatus Saccharimonadales bacterium]|jgi:hypothetical protein